MTRTIWLSAFLFAAAGLMLVQCDTPMPAADPRLEALAFHAGSAQSANLIVGFDPDTLAYDVAFPKTESVAVLSAKPRDPSAVPEARHDGVPVVFTWDATATIDVPLGQSEVTIAVSVDTGGSSPDSVTYRVRIQRGDPCEGVTCDDDDECTEDLCNPFNGKCHNAPLPNGTPCADGTGICRAALCLRAPQISFTGPEEDVIGLGQWGLWCVPDEHISYYKADDTFQLWFTQSEAHHFTSPDFDVWTPATIVDGKSVPAFGPSGEGFDRDYAGPGSVIRASNGRDLLMFYHGEYQWPEGGYYATIGLGRSSDEGRTWERLGPVIEGRLPRPDPPPWYGAFGAGGPCAFVDESDGFIYLYYLDWGAPVYRPSGIHLARAPISSDGLPGSWRKYFEGDFSQDGLGGNSDQVIGGAFPSVSYNVALDAYLAVFVTSHGFDYAMSTDRVHWTAQKRLLDRKEKPDPGEPWLLYPSLLSPSQATDSTTDATGYLYYGRGIYGVECHHMVRRPVEIFWDTWLCDQVDCDDENPCTDDSCDFADGSCDHAPVDCSDANDCTVDTCNPTSGCEHAAVADGSPCLGGAGTCRDGSCQARFPCTEQGIRNAIAVGGGPHTFNCTTPATVVTTAEIVIDNDVILDGEGQLTVHGNQTHRVFSVDAGRAAEIIGFRVVGGAASEHGGGIVNYGTLTLTNATVANNSTGNGRGGGIFNADFGVLTLRRSTVSGNVAAYGGGLLNDGLGSLELTNTTISGNSSTDGGGGGIVNVGTAALVSTTLAFNSATEIGAAIASLGPATLRNTIVAGDCWLAAPLDSLGGNIESEGNSCGLGHPSDQAAVPAPGLMLGPLQFNGGPTLTHALLSPDSAAVDVPETLCIDAAGQPLTTDQRGVSRPQGPACDAGAFELEQP